MGSINSVRLKSQILPKIWSVENFQNELKSTDFKFYFIFKFWELGIFAFYIEKPSVTLKNVCYI